MAFKITKKADGNRGGDRQRINLSRDACATIETDMMQFGFEKRSTFLNLVFQNYYAAAAASISIRIEDCTAEIKRILKDAATPSVLEAFEGELEKQLKEAIQKYPKGEGFNIRINNRNYEYLTQE